MREEITRPIPPELDDCKPSPGWALLKPLQRTGTRGGLLLPTDHGDAEILTGIRVGRVARMGPPRQLEFGGLEAVRCSEGNTVLYDASKGLIEVNMEGTEHHLVRHMAIAAECKASGDLYKIPEPPVRLEITSEAELEARLPSPLRGLNGN